MAVNGKQYIKSVLNFADDLSKSDHPFFKGYPPCFSKSSADRVICAKQGSSYPQSIPLFASQGLSPRLRITYIAATVYNYACTPPCLVGLSHDIFGNHTFPVPYTVSVLPLSYISIFISNTPYDHDRSIKLFCSVDSPRFRSYGFNRYSTFVWDIKIPGLIPLDE